MKLIRLSGVKAETASNPLFTGGTVTMQPIVTKDMGKNFTISQVNFSKGARNKFHTHTSDQVLIITSGKGIVATEKEQITVVSGDVIHIPAGENHWHGATPDSAMSHIYVTAQESKTTQNEK